MTARTRATLAAVAVLAIVALVWWQRRGAGPHDASGPGGSADSSGVDGRSLPRRSGGGSGSSSSGRSRTAEDDDGAAIEGTVVDARHLPVDGARVAAVIADRVSTLSAAQRIARETLSAGGGRFRLDHLSAGPFGLTATFPGRAAGYKGGITLAPGQTLSGVEVVLGDGGATIRGTVSDSGGGAIPGARVRAIRYSTDDGDIFATQADDAGRFAITLGVGSYTFAASSPGYAPREVALLVRRDETLDFKLDPSSGVHGTVVKKSDGSPTAGAEVILEQRSGRRWLGTKQTSSDAAGRFAFEDLAAGEFQLSARSGSMAAHLSKTITVGLAQRADDVVLELVPARTVSGRVKDPEGHGIAGAEVSLGDADRGWGKSVDGSTDADGRFRIEGVFSGHYQPFARAPGYSTASGDDFELGSADKSGIEIVLQPGASVNGRVTGSDGAPVEGALVRVAVREGSTRGRVLGNGVDRTRADGSFHLDDLPAGTCSVDAAHPAHGRAAPPSFELGAGESEKIDLVLREIASISGKVSWDDGGAAAGVEVYAIGQNGVASDVTGPDGRYELRTLDSGRWTLEATRNAESSLDENDPGARVVDLLSGQHVTGIDLTLAKQGAELSGTVETADGSPIADAEVQATSSRTWGSGAGATTGKDGAFHFEDLDPGEYNLRAIHPGYAPATLQVDAGAGDVKIVMQAESVLAGKAIGGDGRPVADYHIGAFAPNADGLSWRAPQKSQEVHDPSGVFEIGGLEPGEYDLVVSADDGRTGTLAAVTVTAGRRKDGLVVKVAPGATVKGRLVELESGQPLAGAKLNVYGNGAPQSRTVGPDGSFLLEAIPPGWSLYVTAWIDPARYVLDHWTIPIPSGGGSVDIGTIKLIAEPMAATRGPGLGIVADWRDGNALVLFSESGTPADLAGIHDGDILTSIGGQNPAGLGAAGLTRLQQGPPGSSVDVSWRTPGGATRTATLVRQ